MQFTDWKMLLMPDLDFFLIIIFFFIVYLIQSPRACQGRLPIEIVA